MIPLLICICSICSRARQAALLLKPLPTGAQAPAPPSGDFSFIVGGDNRAAARGVPAPPSVGETFAEARILHPALVIWTGDTIYGSDDTLTEAAAEYRAFLKLAAQAGAPVYNSPGSHEIFKRRDLESLYERKMGRLYGSFDFGASHFIALDTETIGIQGNLGSAQLAWLRSDLAAHAGSRSIFVFMHQPPLC